MIRVYTNRYQTAVFNKEILKKYKTHDCFCRRNPWRHDKVIMLNVKNASFQFHAKCLKKISDILYKKAESTDTVWLEKFDRRVVKIALKFALNPKKYEKQPLSKETRFNIIKFAAKFNFSSKITEKMLDAGIYVKLIEYAEDTLNEYLMDLLPKAFDKFPEVERHTYLNQCNVFFKKKSSPSPPLTPEAEAREATQRRLRSRMRVTLYLMDLLPKAFDKFPEVKRYPEFLKINERKRNKFLVARDANRKLIAETNDAKEKRKQKYITLLKVIVFGAVWFLSEAVLKPNTKNDDFLGFVASVVGIRRRMCITKGNV
uniref:BTB domain-containing protein n=1 Tax=Panagrellus redivivus TaxID=6233 RepID=A0A7E4VTT0_PANRE